MAHSLAKTVISSIGLFVYGTVNLILGGFVVSKFWKWFVASTFKMPEISLFQGTGLHFFVLLLFVPASVAIITANKDHAPSGPWFIQLLYTFVYAAMLLLGFVWHVATKGMN